MFIIVDASIWVARLVSEDVFYKPVKEWMYARLEEDDQFLAPSLLFAEIGGAISRWYVTRLNWRLNLAYAGQIRPM